MGLSHRNKFLFVSKPLNLDHAMFILKKRANRQNVQAPGTPRPAIDIDANQVGFNGEAFFMHDLTDVRLVKSSDPKTN